MIHYKTELASLESVEYPHCLLPPPPVFGSFSIYPIYNGQSLNLEPRVLKTLGTRLTKPLFDFKILSEEKLSNQLFHGKLNVSKNWEIQYIQYETVGFYRKSYKIFIIYTRQFSRQINTSEKLIQYFIHK
jgi:hypothetical protein